MGERPPFRPGCYLRLVVDFLIMLVVLVVGMRLGEAIGGPEGAQAGVVAGGVAVLFLPWRRWLWGRRRWPW